MKNIKWIFFDIGSTLIDESVAYKSRIEKTIVNTDISFDVFYDKMIEFYRQNKKGDKETVKHFGLTLAPWNSDDEVVYPEAEACLKTLSKKYKLGIIANQNFGSEERLEKFGLLKYINLVVASAEEGVAKPDLRIFEIAIARANCKPDEAVMVGDRLDNDIAPANKIGMKTVWIKQGFGGLATVQSNEEKSDIIINSLTELTEYFQSEEPK